METAKRFSSLKEFEKAHGGVFIKLLEKLESEINRKEEFNARFGRKRV